MKTLATTLSLLALGASPLLSQNAAPALKRPVSRPAATGTTTATSARTAQSRCATDIPPLSAKIPALPAGSSCPKPLYTITSIPTVKLSYVSPLVTPGLGESLGIDTASFSLNYVDTKVGSGHLAQPHQWYSIHYTGYLADGTKFDSSLDRGEPISIHYGEGMVIKGWDTGFDGMHVGGKRRLFIPFQLAYGPNGRPPAIPAKAELIFDVELVAQSDTQPAPKAPPAPPTPKPATTEAKPTATAPEAAPKPAAPPQ